MQTERYSQIGYAELEWWTQRLEEEDREALRANCAEMGAVRMRRHALQIREILSNSLGKGTRQRAALLRQAPDQKDRHALLICAHYRLRCACHWIDKIGPFAEAHLIGRPSSDRVRQAACAVEEFFDEFPPLWPFDDGSDPFGEGLLHDRDADDDEPCVN